MKEKATETKSTTRVFNDLYLLSVLVKDPADMAEFTALVEKHKGSIKKTEDLGKRQLAFPVKKERELTLLSIFFTTDAENIPGLTDTLRHEEKSYRHLLTKWNDDYDRPAKTFTSHRVGVRK